MSDGATTRTVVLVHSVLPEAEALSLLVPEGVSAHDALQEARRQNPVLYDYKVRDVFERKVVDFVNVPGGKIVRGELWRYKRDAADPWNPFDRYTIIEIGVGERDGQVRLDRWGWIPVGELLDRDRWMLATPPAVPPPMEYVGLDDWSRRLYRLVEEEILLVDVDGLLHTVTDFGEPCSPTRLLTPVEGGPCGG